MSTRVTAAASIVIGGLLLAGASSVLADGLLDRFLQVLGISANPSQMKGDSDVIAGAVWVADLDRGTQSVLTSDTGYRWPIYEPAGGALIALKGDSLVRILVKKGEVKVIRKIQNVEKLVGFDRKNPDQLLVILANDTAPLALLSLKTGTLSVLPYDPKSAEHRRMLSHARGEERVFGPTRLYVKTNSKQGMEGELEWGDVYLHQGNATPRNITNCDGVSCGQPSLSPTGKTVVYIRAG